jgi:hypothetical protein
LLPRAEKVFGISFGGALGIPLIQLTSTKAVCDKISNARTGSRIVVSLKAWDDVLTEENVGSKRRFCGSSDDRSCLVAVLKYAGCLNSNEPQKVVPEFDDLRIDVSKTLTEGRLN